MCLYVSFVYICALHKHILPYVNNNCGHVNITNITNMESRLNMYDIYLHVKKMKLKSPDIFLTLVLKEFEVTNLGRFFMTLLYITCFLRHYLSHSVPILRAIFHVFAYKIRNLYNRWNESWSTYSTYAQNLRREIHSKEDQD